MNINCMWQQMWIFRGHREDSDRHDYGPEAVHALIFRTCECYLTWKKRDLVDVNKVVDFEMGMLS